MNRYFIRRLLATIPLMFVISIFVFMFIHLIPGDPAKTLAGVEASVEEVEAIREEFGLNKPILVQYVDYMKNLFHGDMGRSLKSNLPVTEMIASRMHFTLRLVVAGMIWAPFLGIFIGVLCAIFRGKGFDHFGMLFAITGLSAPGFWLGLMLMLLFSLKLGWLPSYGAGSLKHFILPTLTVCMGSAAGLLRLTRSAMLETVRQEYIRTAKAKGASPKRVIWKHALRNALLPVVTTLGTSFGASLGGAIIAETVFAMPGMGTLITTAIRQKDIPMVMGATLFLATLFSLIILIVDVLYAFIDPRIKAKYQNGGKVRE